MDLSFTTLPFPEGSEPVSPTSTSRPPLRIKALKRALGLAIGPAHILRHLIENFGELVTIDDLRMRLEDINGRDMSDESIRGAISRVRDKLADQGTIKADQGAGYRLHYLSPELRKTLDLPPAISIDPVFFLPTVPDESADLDIQTLAGLLTVEEVISVCKMARAEAHLLLRLMSSFGRFVLVQELRDHMQISTGLPSTEDAIRTSIKRMREVLRDEGTIETRRGIGFRLTEMSPDLSRRLREVRITPPYPITINSAIDTFNLSRASAAVLARLAISHGRYVPTCDLIAALKEARPNLHVDAETIRKNITLLRTALAKKGHITAAHGSGYRLMMAPSNSCDEELA